MPTSYVSYLDLGTLLLHTGVRWLHRLRRAGGGGGRFLGGLDRSRCLCLQALGKLLLFSDLG